MHVAGIMFQDFKDVLITKIKSTGREGIVLT